MVVPVLRHGQDSLPSLSKVPSSPGRCKAPMGSKLRWLKDHPGARGPS